MIVWCCCVDQINLIKEQGYTVSRKNLPGKQNVSIGSTPARLRQIPHLDEKGKSSVESLAALGALLLMGMPD